MQTVYCFLNGRERKKNHEFSVTRNKTKNHKPNVPKKLNVAKKFSYISCVHSIPTGYEIR